MITVLVFVLILSVLVFVHEAGHFFVARRFGVKVYEFGLGFPPRAFGYYKNKEGKWQKLKKGADIENLPSTVYSLNWIPLGGFVKIKGEEGEFANDNDSFAYKKIWQRFLILVAGVSMNFVLAIVLFSVALGVGFPTNLNDNFFSGAQVRDQKIFITSLKSDYPAQKAGLKSGDILLEANGKKFASIEKFSSFIAKRDGQEVALKLKRGEEIMEKKVVPRQDKEVGRAIIGVNLVESGVVSYPWYKTFYYGSIFTWKLLIYIIKAFGQVVKTLLVGQKVTADVVGPVGIAVLTGEAIKKGIIYVIQLTALLSLNLGIINFLPFPALDGGRALFLGIEKLRGRPVDKKVESMVHNTGFVLLMILVVIITFRDIAIFTSLSSLGGKFFSYFK